MHVKHFAQTESTVQMVKILLPVMSNHHLFCSHSLHCREAFFGGWAKESSRLLCKLQVLNWIVEFTQDRQHSGYVQRHCWHLLHMS